MLSIVIPLTTRSGPFCLCMTGWL